MEYWQLPPLSIYDAEQFAKKHNLDSREFENFLLNFATIVTESTYNEGYQDGYNEGMEIGDDEGYARGRADEHNDDYDDMITREEAERMEEGGVKYGEKKGYELGYKKGYEDGVHSRYDEDTIKHCLVGN
jgi:flagellar biosynthesis/type III secretory pathway protein FliH